MKRTAAAVLLVTAVIMTAVFSACGSGKTAISAADFIKAAEDNGMTVEDSGGIYTDSIFTGSQLANKDGWSVVFFTIRSAEDAANYYGTVKEYMIAQKTGKGSAAATERDGWASYSQLNGDRFMYVCYIGSTMVYVDTDGVNRTAVTDFLKKIGY